MVFYSSTAASPARPFGGVRNSDDGRKRPDAGSQAFVNKAWIQVS
jgi:hypothetical protein